MALIKCPNCGKPVSDKAIACPNCRYTLNHDIHSVATYSVYSQPSEKLGLKTMLNISGILFVIFAFLSAIVTFLKVNSDLFTTVFLSLISITAFRFPLLGLSLLLITKKSTIKTISMCCLALVFLWEVYVSLGYIIIVLTHYNLIECNDTLYRFLTSQVLTPQEIPQIVYLLISLLFLLFISACIYKYRKTFILIPLSLVAVLLVKDVILVLNLLTINSIFIAIFDVCISLLYGFWFMIISKKSWHKLVNSQQ